MFDKISEIQPDFSETPEMQGPYAAAQVAIAVNWPSGGGEYKASSKCPWMYLKCHYIGMNVCMDVCKPAIYSRALWESTDKL